MLQSQLDLWVELGGATDEAQAIMDESLKQIQNGQDLMTTKLGELLAKDNQVTQMSEQEKTIWEQQLADQTTLINSSGALKAKLDELADDIMNKKENGGEENQDNPGESEETVGENNGSGLEVNDDQTTDTGNTPGEEDLNLW